MNLRQLTYRQKLIGLWALAALFALLLWNLRVAPVLELANRCSEIVEALERSSQNDGRQLHLETRQKRINSVVTSGDNGSNDLQKAVLEKVTSACHDLDMRLDEFPEPKKTVAGKFLVETTPIRVQGNFQSLLQLMHRLEQVWRKGKVAGVHFELAKNRKSRKQELTALIYFQQVKPLTP